VITSVLEAALVVTVEVDAVVSGTAVVVAVAVLQRLPGAPVGWTGPTGITVVVPDNPTVVIAVDAGVEVEAAPGRVAAQGLDGAGGSTAERDMRPADAAPAMPSASKATAPSTRRAIGSR
jgi:hypothetical protein